MTDPVVIFDGSIAGTPFSAQRGRCKCSKMNKPYAFTPTNYDDELKRVAWLLLEGRRSTVALDAGVGVEVVMRCYLPDRRPKDVDNLGKTVLDAGSKVLWDDDRQVMRLDASKVYGVGAGHAHTRLLVRTVGDYAPVSTRRG